MPKTKIQKQREAAERQHAYDALSPNDKLARAIKRGHTKTREAKRLRKAI